MRTSVVYAIILCCLSSLSQAAGIQLLESDPNLAGAIWYPCAGESKDIPLGSLAMPLVDSLLGAKDCPVTGTKLPLVIVSHGRGGWFGANHDVEEALADAGFIVAAINHPGDNGNDSSQRDSLSVWISRPAEIVRLLDFLLNDWKDRAVVDPARIGIFGFSLGGYTGPVLAGANPDFHRFANRCTDTTGACEQLHRGEIPPVLPHEPRIKAAVVADAALTSTFTPASLVGIHIPCKSGDRNWVAQARTRRALRVSPAACRASRTFASCPPDTSDFYRRARRGSRRTCRAYAPIRPASIGPPFTVTSTRASSGSFASIS